MGFEVATDVTNYDYEMIPGNALVDWCKWLKSVYDSYDAEMVEYKKQFENPSVDAPPDDLFGATVYFGAKIWYGDDEWQGTGFGSTEAHYSNEPISTNKRKPSQPIEVPAKLASLTSAITYNGKAGYGWPSTYMLNPVAGKSGKSWGTLAGGAQSSSTTTAWTDADSTYSMRKTSNVGVKTCDNSYLMITGYLKAPANAGTAKKTIELKVTATNFQSTLSE